jgi:hypothetical protein
MYFLEQKHSVGLFTKDYNLSDRQIFLVKLPRPSHFPKLSKVFSHSRPRLKNVDRSSAQEISVTVGNITVTITDYKLLPDNSLMSEPLSHSTSNESLNSSLTSSDQATEISQVNNAMSVDS